MSRANNIKYPLCNHKGQKDCFCKDCNNKCILLTDTDFYIGKCPFYKSRYSNEVTYNENKK